MMTLKQSIIDSLDDSRDCIEITGYARNFEYDIEEDTAKRAEAVVEIIKAYIMNCERTPNAIALTEWTEAQKATFRGFTKGYLRGFKYGVKVNCENLLEGLE